MANQLCSTKIFDSVVHLVEFQYGGKQLEKTYPIPDAMFVLLAKDNAGMLGTGSSKVHVVGIVGAEDIAEVSGPYKMIAVTVAQETQVAYGNSINTASLQLRSDSDRNIFIEIESNR